MATRRRESAWRSKPVRNSQVTPEGSFDETDSAPVAARRGRRWRSGGSPLYTRPIATKRGGGAGWRPLVTTIGPTPFFAR